MWQKSNQTVMLFCNKSHDTNNLLWECTEITMQEMREAKLVENQCLQILILLWSESNSEYKTRTLLSLRVFTNACKRNAFQYTLKYFLYRRTACIADLSQLTLIWVWLMMKFSHNSCNTDTRFPPFRGNIPLISKFSLSHSTIPWLKDYFPIWCVCVHDCV